LVSDIVILTIVLQSLLLAFVLFTHKGPKVVSNRLLATFLLIIAFQFFSLLLISFSLYTATLQGLMCVFGLAYGPLFYLYTSSLLYSSFSFKVSYIAHFIPSFIFITGALVDHPLCADFGDLLYISILTYLGLSVWKINKYQRAVKNIQSLIRSTELDWLKWTWTIFSVVILFDIVDRFVWTLDFLDGAPITYLALLFLIFWMVYKGLKQPHIFIGISEQDEAMALGKNNFDQEVDEHIQKELEEIKSYIEREKSFKQADLSINILAENLNVSPRRLSFMINNYLGKNFMTFINDYRIEMAKKQLIDSDDSAETVLEVMYDVGFNSKSSFYTLFKSKTGYTPLAYKRKYSKRN
jgi:AraC-like DNA-binding protein